MDPFVVAGVLLVLLAVPVVLRARLDRARDRALAAWAQVDSALTERASAAVAVAEASGGDRAVAAAAHATEHARTIPAQAAAQDALLAALAGLPRPALVQPARLRDALTAADGRVAEVAERYAQARARYEARRTGLLGRVVAERSPVLEAFPLVKVGAGR